MSETTTSLRFAQLARKLSNTAQDLGLEAPGFRSPPPAGSDRSVRRYGDGSYAVSVLISRPWEEVAVDMVDGILHANGAGMFSDHPQREEWRGALLSSVDLPAPSDAGLEVGF